MKRVVLGLSGGVDSAVAAYLLKKQGYEVICVFMRNWDSSLNNDILGNPTNDDDVCPQEKDYQDAQAVATHLGLEIRRVETVSACLTERRKEEKAERSAIALRSDGAAARCERTVRLFGKTDAESDAEPL